MSFPRYPDYKDSGVAWLGEVPGHWKSVPMKHLVRLQSGGTPSKENEAYWEGTIPWASAKDMKAEFLTDTEDHITKHAIEQGAASLLESGSVIFVVRGMILARMFPVAVTRAPMAINQDLKAAIPGPHLISDYLAWYLRGTADESLCRLDEAGHGTKALRMDAWTSLEVALPPLAEQASLAAFLDRETAKIDALVVEQERLIDLLKEKRQAVISHAVTKGLNPDAPMKDSGIEWLGALPDHWERVQLGRLCRYISDGPHFSPKYVDDGITFLSARNVKVDGWDFDDVKYISDDDYEDFSRRIIPEFGDILYTKGGTTGVARVVDFRDKFQVWVHIAVLKIDDLISNPWFVSYALNSIGCYEQSQILTRGATNNDLGLTRLVKIWLALPPILEQFAIATFLDRETAKLDSLVAEAQHAIDLLKERRAALISAAVTGRIDVRGLVADNHAPAERVPA